MTSGHSLRNTGWKVRDFGGIPSQSEVTVECDDCDATTTADDLDDWEAHQDSETYETTTLCPNCL